MRSNRSLTMLMVVGLASSALLVGQDRPPAADNTRSNRSDTAKPTADQQSQKPADLKITQEIRQLVTQDKLLSTNAKNVKIITQDGNVVLAGPVESETEKKSIETKAVQVAGAGHVKNDIQIAAKQPEKKN